MVWYYIDDNSQRQGPFKSKKLQKWYNRGLLPQTLQLLSTQTQIQSDVDAKEQWTSLKSLVRSSSDPSKNLFTHCPATEGLAGVVGVAEDSTRQLRAQILMTQFEIAITELQRDALRTVSTSLTVENRNLQKRDVQSNIQLMLAGTARQKGRSSRQ